MTMNLDYVGEIIQKPLKKYQDMLRVLQREMVADDDDSDDGLLTENVHALANNEN